MARLIRHVLRAFGLGVLLAVPSGLRAQLVAFDVADNASCETATFVLNTNVSTPRLCRGPGITATTTGGNGYAASGWTETSLANAVSVGDYFGASFTVSAGFVADVVSLRAVFRRSGTGPLNLALRSSADGFASTIATATLISNTSDQQVLFDFADLVGASGTLEFRIYSWGSTNAGGTLRVTDTTVSPSQVPSVQINGTTRLGLGACCIVATGACQSLTSAACTTAGGTFTSIGQACASTNCPQPTGACCYPSIGTCTLLIQADCQSTLGAFTSAGLSCAAANCPTGGPTSDATWTAAVGGSLQDYSKWTPWFPGSQGRATFGGAGGTPFTVTTPADVTYGSFVVRNQNVTLDLQGRTLNLTTYLGIAPSTGDDATLTLSSGRISLPYVPNSSRIDIGSDQGASVGALIVRNPGTAFTAPEVTVGRGPGAPAGLGTLEVLNGALFDAASVALGDGQTGVGMLAVSGAGSRLNGFVIAGRSSSGTAIFSDGAVVSSFNLDGNPTSRHNCYIGVDAPGAVTVQGVGTEWRDINGLWVGGLYFSTSQPGNGTLNVLAGGAVRAESVSVGELSPDEGTVIVSGSGSVLAAGSVSVGGEGVGRLEVGSGGLVQTSGGGVTIRRNGLLSGTGRVAPAPGQRVEITDTGRLAPGSMGQELGNLTIAGGMRVTNQLVNTGGVVTQFGHVQVQIGGNASGLYDSITIENGTATLGGTLSLSLLNGFVPSDGDSFTILTATTIQGRFAQIEYPTLPPGLLLEVVYSPTAITLNVRAIVGLSVRPSLSLGLGHFHRLAAVAVTGVTSQGTSVDVSSQVQWTSDSPGVVAVVAGSLQGLQNGQTTVRAAVGGFSAPVLVTVGEPPLPLRISRINLAPGGSQTSRDSISPTISGDGRLIAYASLADALTLGDTNNQQDIFLFDRTSGLTSLQSSPLAGGQSDNASLTPALSGDGRVLAFVSRASNLVGTDPAAAADVFVKSLLTGTLDRVSSAGPASGGNGDSLSPAVSRDGSIVSFHSDASDLISGDTNNASDIYVWNRASAELSRQSVAPSSAQSDGDSFFPSIAAAGRFGVFYSDSTNLVLGPVPARAIYLRDIQTQQMELVSIGPDGAPVTTNGYSSVSTDGRFIAFEGPRDAALDTASIFVRDRASQVTRLVSADSTGQSLGGSSLRPRITPDGRYVVFYRRPSAGAELGYRQVYRRDLIGGGLVLVSANLSGEPGDFDSSTNFAPAISNDGRYVAFSSRATNLVAEDSNAAEDIFLADLGQPCIADFNANTVVNIDDIFIYLNAWFATDPRCDVSGNGLVNIDDIFIFLNLWFQGC